jgi:DNA-binding NarL/FixJ family response regulator
MSTYSVAPAGWDSLRSPINRLRAAIEQADRELESVRRAYLEAVQQVALEASVDTRAAHGRDLTPQEARVARLLTLGRSNREIAADLHVSIHTVKSHVQSILRKRAMRSRWQLAVRPHPEAPQDNQTRHGSADDR